MNGPLSRAWFSSPGGSAGNATVALPTEQETPLTTILLSTTTTTTTTTAPSSLSATAHDTNQPPPLQQLQQQTQEVVVQITGETKEEVPTTTTTANTPSENNQSTNEINNTKKPLNILILYPDDWRHDTIGKENSIVQTPFLDSLADQGIRFRQNAVTSSICWVSRATLFTGQWASRHQSHKLICPHFAAGYLWNETSWPGILRNHGYYTGHVVREKGKDGSSNNNPTHRPRGQYEISLDVLFAIFLLCPLVAWNLLIR